MSNKVHKLNTPVKAIDRFNQMNSLRNYQNKKKLFSNDNTKETLNFMDSIHLFVQDFDSVFFLDQTALQMN